MITLLIILLVFGALFLLVSLGCLLFSDVIIAILIIMGIFGLVKSIKKKK